MPGPQHQSANFAQEPCADALNDREFEALLEGAHECAEGFPQLEARFLVFATGRLGLRRAEITHITEEWIDWQSARIEIPGHQPCTKGKSEGLCADCRTKVTQIVEHNDQYDDADYDAIATNWWRPKTEAAVRGVPFEWEPRAELVLERFFDRFDRFRESATTISRRLNRAAEHAIGVDPDRVYPRSMRATAAAYQAARGLEPPALKRLMGWANMHSAEVHIQHCDANVKAALREIHSL